VNQLCNREILKEETDEILLLTVSALGRRSKPIITPWPAHRRYGEWSQWFCTGKYQANELITEKE